LHIVWPKLPGFKWQYKTNNYLTNVLGHEGPNSLLSELAKEGFVTSIMASSSLRLYDRDGEIKLEISLTEKGVDRFYWVLSLVFAFINKIKK
jgi:insulysin